ncbi:hypothetical protein BGW80DRAFT_1292367 [Lactifluus volemus]|nr:hypothetical protein BGW80DRAFT_1292367 [Lactifluus volemus]
MDPATSAFTEDDLKNAGSWVMASVYPLVTQCINYSNHLKSPVSPILAMRLPPSLLPSTATAAGPYVISDWEKTTYYHGISLDPPKLLYRSDLQTNPFPIPKGRFPHYSTKTVYGVFNSPLNDVWDDVAPQICKILKARGIRYSAVKAARFVSHGEDGKDSLGPINAHDVSPDILSLLEANGVEGAVVEWYEGAIEKLSGPALLRREDDDAQGSVALFFHENKDRRGDPSAKVFAVSNCHVLRKNTTHVRLAGFRRFQRGLDEIKDCVAGLGMDADLLTRRIAALEAKPESEDSEEVAKDKAALEAKGIKIGVIETFYKDTIAQWGDIARRNIGHVAWAPKISVDVEGHRYTWDIGTFEVDAAKFKSHFKGNVVDLGAKFTPWKLTKMFYAQSGGRTVFKFPADGQLRINGCVTRELLANPDCFDSNGEPCLIVMKDGNTTDLTVGRYAGLEAYLCDELGVESIELPIYNYDKQSGSFSAKGDSGSLIFDGNGRSNHVTYATPAWWIIERIKLHYPHADFNRESF